ncbi:MAG: hypothetical protein IBX71_10345 [Candidatus Desulforudis sp.]|nr:hypothetical protein [Desulforudis sp.]
MIKSGAAFLGQGAQWPGLHVQKAGVNYIKNPSAGVNLAGSSIVQGATIERQASGGILGGSCWKITTGSNQWSGIEFKGSDAFVLPAVDADNDQYALSFWAKLVATEGATDKMEIYASEISPWEIYALATNQVMVLNEWRYYELVFTLDDTDLALAIHPHSAGVGSAGTVLLIDGLTLEPERSFNDVYQGEIKNKSYGVPPYNGDSPGCAWTGTAHASTSTRTQGKADFLGEDIPIDFDLPFWFGLDITLGFNRSDAFETISTEWLSIGRLKGDGLGWVDNVALVLDWHSPFGISGDYKIYFHREEAGSGAEIVMPEGVKVGDVMRVVGIFDPTTPNTSLHLSINEGATLSNTTVLAGGPAGQILPMPAGHKIGIGYANGWEGPWQTNSAHRNLVLEQGIPTQQQIDAYLGTPEEPLLNGGYHITFEEEPMARAAVSPQASSHAGITPTWTAPTADGIMIPGDGQTKVMVRNTNASPCVVTVQTPEKRSGLDVAEREVTVPATTGERDIGPFPAATFNRPSGVADAGKVYIDFSIQSGVTYYVFK